MTNVNERSWFKNILTMIGDMLREKYHSHGFRQETMEELANSLRLIPKGWKKFFIKFFEGYGMTFVHDGEDVNSIKVVSHTTWVWTKNLFKIHANAWNLLFHPQYPLDPLFSVAVRRTKNFLTNFPNESRVYRDAAKHWIECEACKRKLFWRIMRVATFEERYIYFDNRELYCSNKECRQYGKETGLTLLDIKLPNEKDTKIFIAPIVRSIARRKKDWNRLNPEELPRPSRWIRFWTKLGHVFHQQPGVYANDTAYEKGMEKSNISPYASDLRYEQFSGQYPNG